MSSQDIGFNSSKQNLNKKSRQAALPGWNDVVFRGLSDGFRHPWLLRLGECRQGCGLERAAGDYRAGDSVAVYHGHLLWISIGHLEVVEPFEQKELC